MPDLEGGGLGAGGQEGVPEGEAPHGPHAGDRAKERDTERSGDWGCEGRAGVVLVVPPNGKLGVRETT